MSNNKGTSAIESPQGGGAQSGLGEKFSPNLFTGTGNFSILFVIDLPRIDLREIYPIEIGIYV